MLGDLTKNGVNGTVLKPKNCDPDVSFDTNQKVVLVVIKCVSPPA